MVMNIIKYTGLSRLNEDEQDILKKIIEEEYIRIKRLLKDITDLKIDIKMHDKGGKRKLYMLDLRAISPTGIFSYKGKEAEIKKSPYYDIATASHKAIDALEQEIKHKLKINSGAWKKKESK